MATNVKILLRRGLRSELSASGLDAGELGYTEDTKQLYVGTTASVDEIIFDPFANAQSIVQTYLNLSVSSGGPTEQGREIDEDLIIRNVSNVPVLLNDMATYGIITAGAFEPTVSVTAGSFVSVSDPAGLFVIDREYIIEVSGTTDFTLIGAADSNVGTTFTATGNGTETYSAGSFVIGREYTILTTGTTDFTLIGATDSNIGTVFTATGVGTGTGTANFVGTGRATYGISYTIATVGTTDFTLIGAADNNIGTVFKATGVGTGTGTATYGKEYKIKTLGTTTQAEWNTTAGTSGLTYAVDSIFTAKTVGTGTGTAIDTYDHFYANLFASERKNVEVLTENSFSQVYANMHLQSHTSTDGRRPDLFKKELLINDASTPLTEGTFLKYAKTDSSSFFIDYSLKQVGTSDTFVRVGTIRVINGEAITPALTGLVKLTDDNTEIWQDTGINSATAGSFVIGTRYKIVTVGTTDYTLVGSTDSNVGTTFTATGVGVGNGTATYADNIAQSEEFSNIEFTSVIEGTHMKIKYTQDAGFTTEISYTVKRWTM